METQKLAGASHLYLPPEQGLESPGSLSRSKLLHPFPSPPLSSPQKADSWASPQHSKIPHHPHPASSSLTEVGRPTRQQIWCVTPELGVSGPSSSCEWNPQVFADDARGCCSRLVKCRYMNRVSNNHPLLFSRFFHAFLKEHVCLLGFPIGREAT